NAREEAGRILSTFGEEPDSVAVPANNEPVSKMLDLVQPFLAGGGEQRDARQTWFDEVVEDGRGPRSRHDSTTPLCGPLATRFKTTPQRRLQKINSMHNLSVQVPGASLPAPARVESN